jgi:hypothetical protein
MSDFTDYIDPDNPPLVWGVTEGGTFYHCGRPAYWDDDESAEDGSSVYCSKCQEKLA